MGQRALTVKDKINWTALNWRNFTHRKTSLVEQKDKLRVCNDIFITYNR